jgi:hypothetical protein
LTSWLRSRIRRFRRPLSPPPGCPRAGTLTASFTDTRSSLLSRNGLLGQPGVAAGVHTRRDRPHPAQHVPPSGGHHLAAARLFRRPRARRARSPEYPVGGTGALRGRVFLDANGNGVRDPDERGVPDIIVILDGLQATRTDEAGRYRFDGVIDGRHSITVNADALPLPWSIVSDPPAAATAAMPRPWRSGCAP